MDDVQKGERAKNILNDDVFQEAISIYSKTLVRLWENSKSKDEREELWMQQQALRRVVDNLAGFVQNGEFHKMKMKEKGWFK